MKKSIILVTALIVVLFSFPVAASAASVTVSATISPDSDAINPNSPSMGGPYSPVPVSSGVIPATAKSPVAGEADYKMLAWKIDTSGLCKGAVIESVTATAIAKNVADLDKENVLAVAIHDGSNVIESVTPIVGVANIPGTSVSGYTNSGSAPTEASGVWTTSSTTLYALVLIGASQAKEISEITLTSLSVSLTYDDSGCVTNNPPNTEPDIYTIPNYAAYSGNVISNDSDPDGDTLTVTNFYIDGDPVEYVPGETATIPGVGAVLINSDGSFIFIPDPNFVGAVPGITYVIFDDKGLGSKGPLVIKVEEAYCPDPYDTSEVLSDDGDCDQDGITNVNEGYLDPVDTDDDAIPDYLDLDTDNDGIPDEVELTDDPDVDGIGNWRDIDSDGDSKLDVVEAGHGASDVNGDGSVDIYGIPTAVPDSYELKDTDGNGIPDFLQVDKTVSGTLPKTGSMIQNELFISLSLMLFGLLVNRKFRKLAK